AVRVRSFVHSAFSMSLHVPGASFGSYVGHLGSSCIIRPRRKMTEACRKEWAACCFVTYKKFELRCGLFDDVQRSGRQTFL
ncbi:hypothetical protein BaRGS_00014691, partial [Batillaria attramentaria]